MGNELTILGRKVSISGVPPAVKRWLERFWLYPEYQTAAHPLRISLSAIPEPSSLEQITWMRHTVRLPDRVLTWLQNGSQWIGTSTRSGLRLVFKPQSINMEIWGTWDSEEPYHYLYLAITEALRVTGLVPLHAAVAARETQVTAFLGRSGTGKSTTLLRLIKAGWTPIAEDLSWIEPGTLRLFGWDRGVRLWPDNAQQFFPTLSGSPERDGKVLIPHDRLGAVQQREGILGTLALLVREDSAAPRWDEPEKSEGVRALWEATGIPLTPQARSGVTDGVERVARQVRFTRLVLGPIDSPLPAPPPSSPAH